MKVFGKGAGNKPEHCGEGNIVQNEKASGFRSNMFWSARKKEGSKRKAPFSESESSHDSAARDQRHRELGIAPASKDNPFLNFQHAHRPQALMQSDSEEDDAAENGLSELMHSEASKEGRRENSCSHCHGRGNGREPHNAAKCQEKLNGLPGCPCPNLECGGCGHFHKKHSKACPRKCGVRKSAPVQSSFDAQQWMLQMTALFEELKLTAPGLDQWRKRRDASEQAALLIKDHPCNLVNKKRGLKGFSGDHYDLLKDDVTDEQLQKLNDEGLFLLAKRCFSRSTKTKKGMIKLEALYRIHGECKERGILEQRKTLQSNADLLKKRKRTMQDTAVEDACTKAIAASTGTGKFDLETTARSLPSLDPWSPLRTPPSSPAPNSFDFSPPRTVAIEPNVYGQQTDPRSDINEIDHEPFVPDEPSHPTHAPWTVEQPVPSSLALATAAFTKVLENEHSLSLTSSMGLEQVLRVHYQDLNLDDSNQMEALLKTLQDERFVAARSKLLHDALERSCSTFDASPQLIAANEDAFYCQEIQSSLASEDLLLKEQVEGAVTALAEARKAAEAIQDRLKAARVAELEADQRLQLATGKTVIDVLLIGASNTDQYFGDAGEQATNNFDLPGLCALTPPCAPEILPPVHSAEHMEQSLQATGNIEALCDHAASLKEVLNSGISSNLDCSVGLRPEVPVFEASTKSSKEVNVQKLPGLGKSGRSRNDGSGRTQRKRGSRGGKHAKASSSGTNPGPRRAEHGVMKSDPATRSGQSCGPSAGGPLRPLVELPLNHPAAFAMQRAGNAHPARSPPALSSEAARKLSRTPSDATAQIDILVQPCVLAPLKTELRQGRTQNPVPAESPAQPRVSALSQVAQLPTQTQNPVPASPAQPRVPAPSQVAQLSARTQAPGPALPVQHRVPAPSQVAQLSSRTQTLGPALPVQPRVPAPSQVAQLSSRPQTLGRAFPVQPRVPAPSQAARQASGPELQPGTVLQMSGEGTCPCIDLVARGIFKGKRKQHYPTIFGSTESGSSLVARVGPLETEIKLQDMRLLLPAKWASNGQGPWLNDEILNAFLSNLPVQKKSVFIATTFFLNKVFLDQGDYCFESLVRWFTAQRLQAMGASHPSLASHDLILAPVNWRNSHWALAAVDPHERTAYFYDSSKGLIDSARTEALLRKFVNFLDELSASQGFSSPRLENLPPWSFMYPVVPQQTNGYDCGVYVAMFTEALASDRSLWQLPIDTDGMRLAILERMLDIGAL